MVEPGGHTTTFAYDDDDNRTLTTYPNGVTQRAAYDASDRLTSIEGTKGASVLTRFAYTYSRSGNQTTSLKRAGGMNRPGNRGGSGYWVPTRFWSVC